MTARRLETQIHPDDRIDPNKAGPQAMRHVTVNVAESPIAWLAARGHLTTAQLVAGERLRVLAAEVVDAAGDPGTVLDARTPI